jgi:crotonobetainyl-CoA:carnitine CoA-transferase CaiB-like acyl-CoA transferase
MTALSGVRILDMTEGVAGPYAASLLGDLGADVIKVERPDGDWGRRSGKPVTAEFSSFFVAMNRNKRDLGLDLSRPNAKEVARRLIAQSDVVLSNYRPGVMDRLGLSYEQCLSLNPQVIYCSISAFGDAGKYGHLRGSDTVMQAVSGMMELIGEPDGQPLRVSFPLIDCASALFAVQGILAALYARTATSTGVKIDLSLLNTAVALQAVPFTDYLVDGNQPPRLGNQNPSLAPAGAFSTRDSRYLSVAMLSELHWKSFCRTVGRADLVDRPDFATNADRVANRDVLNDILCPIFCQKDQADWVTLLQDADVPCSPLNTFDDLVGDHDLAATLPIAAVALPGGKATRTVGNPVRFDGSFPGLATSPPRGGQHTASLLAELGYAEHEVDDLIAEGDAFGARID